MANGMNDRDLIGYCEIHCQTERALFKGDDVNRMIRLAGYPEGYVREVPGHQFFSLHDEMEELVKLSKARLVSPSSALIIDQNDTPAHSQPTAKVIQFPARKFGGPSL